MRFKQRGNDLIVCSVLTAGADGPCIDQRRKDIIKIEVIGCRDFIKIYESADIKFFHDRLQRKVSEILLRGNSRDLLNFLFCFPLCIHTLYFSFVVSDGIVDTVTYELGNRAERFETAVLRAFGIRRIEGFIDGKISVVSLVLDLKKVSHKGAHLYNTPLHHFYQYLKTILSRYFDTIKTLCTKGLVCIPALSSF